MNGRMLYLPRRLFVPAALLVLGVAASAADAPSASTAPRTAPGAPPALKLHADHITGSVSDMARAIRWYQDVLGFHVDQSGTRGQMKFAEMSIPGFGIALIQQPPGTTQPRGTGARVPEWVHLVFTVADVPGTCAAIKARGGNPYTRDGAPISDYCLLEDSEGNQLEVMQQRR